MSAKVESGPLSWNEIERDRLKNEDVRAMGRGQTATFVFPLAEAKAEVEPQRRMTSLHLLRDQLRNELQRGHEYLEEVEKELAERRAKLAKWPSFEQLCGKNPLPQLAESILVDERIEQFLAGWLGQHEEQLAAVTRELELSRMQDETEQHRLAV